MKELQELNGIPNLKRIGYVLEQKTGWLSVSVLSFDDSVLCFYSNISLTLFQFSVLTVTSVPHCKEL